MVDTSAVAFQIQSGNANPSAGDSGNYRLYFALYDGNKYKKEVTPRHIIRAADINPTIASSSLSSSPSLLFQYFHQLFSHILPFFILLWIKLRKMPLIGQLLISKLFTERPN